MYQTFAQTIFNRVYQVSMKIIPVCTHHAQSLLAIPHPKPRPSPYPPLYPLSRTGNPPHSNPSLPTRTQHPEPPLSRGAEGVSRPSIASKTKSCHPKPKKYLLDKQQQKHLHPHRTSHHNTPLKSTLKRGNTTPHPHYQIEKPHPNLPSREGPRVCHVRAQLPTPKATTQSRQILHSSTDNNKCNISQQLSKNISTHAAPLTVTPPFIPSQEGNSQHHKPLNIK